MLLERVEKWIKEEDVAKIKEAYALAGQVHVDRLRLTGEPHLIHPLNVAYILMDMNADAATVCAGLLHDVLEYSKISREELAAMFGEEVTSLVEGITLINSLNFSGDKKSVIA